MISSSKAIPAKDTVVGIIYKLNGMHAFYMRVTECGSTRSPDEGCMFVSVAGGSVGVISKFSDDTLFKQVDSQLTIDD